MNGWKKPEFVEIRMDAETNCYSSALADDPEGSNPPSAAGPRQQSGNQAGILRRSRRARPYPGFRCRRGLPAVELQLLELCWTEDRDASRESADTMLGGG